MLLKVVRPVLVLGLLALTLLAVSGNEIWTQLWMLPFLLVLWVVVGVLANRSLSRPKITEPAEKLSR